jgi:hypothetical protein
MRTITGALAALLLLAAPAAAQIDSGFYSDDNGYVVKVEVSDTNGPSVPGVDVTVVDSGGTRTTTGVADPGSTAQKPEAKSFPEGTTPRGTTAVRGNNGKVQKKNADGTWSNLRRVKKPKKGLPGHSGPGAPGEEGSSMPQREGPQGP